MRASLAIRIPRPGAVIAAVIAGVLAVSAIAPARAHAQADDAAARDRFQKAEMSFNLGRFVDALDDYKAAYEARPLPAFLFNIAQCYRNLQNFERARFFYRRYLVLDPHAADRRLVEKLIADMSRAIEKQDGAETAPASPAEGGYLAVGDPAPAPAAPPPAARAPTRIAAPVVIAREPEPAPPGPHPIYHRWWFWAGVAAAAAAVTAGVLVATRPDTPTGTLPTIDGR